MRCPWIASLRGPAVAAALSASPRLCWLARLLDVVPRLAKHNLSSDPAQDPESPDLAPWSRSRSQCTIRSTEPYGALPVRAIQRPTSVEVLPSPFPRRALIPRICVCTRLHQLVIDELKSLRTHRKFAPERMIHCRQEENHHPE